MSLKKYLKYKSKYLNLKKQFGGMEIDEMDFHTFDFFKSINIRKNKDDLLIQLKNFLRNAVSSSTNNGQTIKSNSRIPVISEQNKPDWIATTLISCVENELLLNPYSNTRNNKALPTYYIRIGKIIYHIRIRFIKDNSFFEIVCHLERE